MYNCRCYLLSHRAEHISVYRAYIVHVLFEKKINACRAVVFYTPTRRFREMPKECEL